MELALIIQKPLSLISFKVMPLPQCAALRWHYLTINSVTLDFFGRIMGCIYSSFNPDLPIRPPALIMSFLSVNGSREHNALALLKLLSFYFSLPNSSLKCFAWTNSVMLSLASCSNSTSINGLDSMLLVSIALFCLIFCKNWALSFKIWATTFLIFSQLDILPSSCDSRSCLMVMTFTATAGFISGSTSLTYAGIWFGLWSSGWLRKLGPLNYLCDLLDLIPPRRLELSSAGLHADRT